jgi:hypothetical protein
MRHIWKRLVLLLVVFSPGAALAQGGQQHPLMRFTGVLLPLEEKGHSGAPALTVRITDTTWIFRLAKVETLMGKDLCELQLFQVLFPPRVRLVGLAEILRPLQDPEITGKRLAIEGILYPTDSNVVGDGCGRDCLEVREACKNRFFLIGGTVGRGRYAICEDQRR